MRRLLVIGALALACGLALAAIAQAQPARSRLRSFVCQPALDPAARGISVTAVMRPLLGTAKMAMRFQLMRRSRPGARAVSLSGRDLKTWITPTNPPTLGQLPGDVWVVRHPVVDLGAPYIYRFRVTFRWSAADGQVLGRMVRVSRVCNQPEMRPDLAVKAVRVFPLAAAGWDRYSALIRNGGETATGPFNVQILLGAPPNQQTLVQGVQQLQPGTSVVVHFRAPACAAGEPIVVSADPGPPYAPYAVDDPDRANNTLATSCPSP